MNKTCFKCVLASITWHLINLQGMNDATPNSLKDSNVSSKVKTTEEEGIKVCFLVHIILGVRRAC
jgi:hypothetical protein